MTTPADDHTRVTREDRLTATALVRAWVQRDAGALATLKNDVTPGVAGALVELGAILAGASAKNGDAVAVLDHLTHQLITEAKEN